MSTIDISKLDAAKRQIDTAINLFFRESDPVSIHTLVSAAYEILIALAKYQGVNIIIKDTSMIKEEMKAEYIKALNEAQNFFKHADKDPKGLLEFSPKQTESFLWDAVRIYIELTKEKPSKMLAYRSWFYLENPDLFKELYKERFNMTIYNNIRRRYDPGNRIKFFDLIRFFDSLKEEDLINYRD